MHRGFRSLLFTEPMLAAMPLVHIGGDPKRAPDLPVGVPYCLRRLRAISTGTSAAMFTVRQRPHLIRTRLPM
jgi:hypothetical protein